MLPLPARPSVILFSKFLHPKLSDFYLKIQTSILVRQVFTAFLTCEGGKTILRDLNWEANRSSQDFLGIRSLKRFGQKQVTYLSMKTNNQSCKTIHWVISKGNKRHGNKPGRNRDNIGHCFKAILQTGSACLVQGKLFLLYTGEQQAGSFLSARASPDTLIALERMTQAYFFLTRSNSHPQAEINSS